MVRAFEEGYNKGYHLISFRSLLTPEKIIILLVFYLHSPLEKVKAFKEGYNEEKITVFGEGWDQGPWLIGCPWSCWIVGS
jgi:hypothetical protein